MTPRKLLTLLSSTELHPKTIRKSSGRPCTPSQVPSSSHARQKRSDPPSPALYSEAGTINASSVCGGSLEAGSLKIFRIPPRTGDHRMASLGNLQDAHVSQHGFDKLPILSQTTPSIKDKEAVCVLPSRRSVNRSK